MVTTDRVSLIGREFASLFEVGSFVGLTDGQLLERFQASRGEVAERAFATLLHRHGPMVLRTCQRILGDEHDAHDAFQATFLVLVRKGRSLWVRQSLGPWLHRVACRAANQARKARTRREVVERDARAVGHALPVPDVSAEVLAAIHEELERLPDHYRSAIVLCDLEGRTCEQAAQQLGCPLGTVGSRLSRGREKLRHRLIRRGLAPAVGVMVESLTLDGFGATLSRALVAETVDLAIRLMAHGTAGVVPATVATLAHHITRRIIMSQIQTAIALIAVSGALLLVPVMTSRSPAVTLPPAREGNGQRQSKPDDAARLSKDREAADFAKRHEEYLLAEFGNMLPIIHRDQGASFTSREAVLYRDGSVKLWTAENAKKSALLSATRAPSGKSPFSMERASW